MADHARRQHVQRRWLDDTYDQTSNNWALFTHNIFDITDQLGLTVGARYTHEKKKLDATSPTITRFCTRYCRQSALASCSSFPASIPQRPGRYCIDIDDSKTEGKLSGTVVLSWKPTDEMLTYLSYSRGYKAGGLQPRPVRRCGAASAMARLRDGGAVRLRRTAASLDDLEFEPGDQRRVRTGHEV